MMDIPRPRTSDNPRVVRSTLSKRMLPDSISTNRKSATVMLDLPCPKERKKRKQRRLHCLVSTNCYNNEGCEQQIQSETICRTILTAPVLPTIPHDFPAGILKDKSFSASGNSVRYRRDTFRNSRRPCTGQLLGGWYPLRVSRGASDGNSAMASTRSMAVMAASVSEKVITKKLSVIVKLAPQMINKPAKPALVWSCSWRQTKRIEINITTTQPRTSILQLNHRWTEM
mmetsp:Transcript_5499/g.15911  ORF Transcript_5499/g.15911 Transcript_5499/m.15911 type:complete len:228 (-) Transcript_5499:3456-4139(-)